MARSSHLVQSAMQYLRRAYRGPSLAVGLVVILVMVVEVECAQSSGHRSAGRAGAAQTSRSGGSKSDVQSNIAGVASQVHMTFTDPKTGKMLWKASVGRLEAGPGGSGNDVIGTLHTVDGVLYEGGKAANRMLAPTVNIDNSNKIVTATGGVHVISLTQKDTDLHCDKAVWYINENKLIGTGHVVMHKATFTQTGPSFAADTRLQSVVMPAPSDSGVGSSGGRRRIRAHLRQE